MPVLFSSDPDLIFSRGSDPGFFVTDPDPVLSRQSDPGSINLVPDPRNEYFLVIMVFSPASEIYL